MNSQLNPRALALAGGVVCAALAAICFAIYVVLGRPDPWNALFIGSGQSPIGFAVGVAESAAAGAFGGWLAAVTYNRVTRAATAVQ
jgi:hypothetical protein